MKPAIFLAFLVLGCMWGRVSGSCATLVEDSIKCFTDEGLSISIPSADNPQQALEDVSKSSYDATAICTDHLAAYKNAMACAMAAVRECLQTESLENIVPDTDKLLQGMDYLCSKVNDFNSQCVTSKASSMVECVTDVAQELAKEDSPTTIEEIICRAYDITYDCAKKHLASCSGKTQEIYLELLDNYHLPPICANRRPSRSGRRTYVESSASLPSRLSLGGLATAVVLVIYLFLSP